MTKRSSEESNTDRIKRQEADVVLDMQPSTGFPVGVASTPVLKKRGPEIDEVEKESETRRKRLNATAKTVHIFDLPDEVLTDELPKHLSSKEMARLAQTSRRLYGLFQPLLPLTRFLEHVVHGEQDEAERMLKVNPELLTMRATITDYSGRAFENITPFEYTLWALDRHMWEMMLSCLPENEKGARIRDDLYKQYKTHKQDGIHYILDGKSHRELHYDFDLIKKLKHYETVNATKPWWEKECADYWCKGVGSAQRLVPAHVAHEYCRPYRDYQDYKSPNRFKEKKLERRLDMGSFSGRNHYITRNRHWYPLDLCSEARLGVDFAIGSDWNSRCYAASQQCYGNQMGSEELTHLHQVRLSEFVELEQRLASTCKLEQRLVALP